MERVIGSENVASPRLMGLGDTFSLWPLVGKRLAICSDAHLGHGDKAMGVMETIKAISGEDTMQVERKFLPPVQARLRVRFALAVNELPRFGDNSGALAARMKIVPFRQSFAGREDRGLDAKLEAESSGILNWAIEGLQRLHENGRFTEPEASKADLQDFARLVSPIKTFVEDRCIVGAYKVELNLLWKAWQDWCEETKHLPGSREAMGAKLRGLVPSLNRVRLRSGGTRKWFYEGIGIVL